MPLSGPRSLRTVGRPSVLVNQRQRIGRNGKLISITNSIVSAAIRQGVAFTNASVGTNNISRSRIYEIADVAGSNPWIEDWNGYVDTGISTGPQEVGCSQAIVKIAFLKGINFVRGTNGSDSSPYNQSGATSYPVSWSGIAGDDGSSGMAYLKKLDNSVSPPTFNRRSYAQFVADGGSVNGNILTVPHNYWYRSDAVNNLSLNAGERYAIQVEKDHPAQQTSVGITQSGGIATVTGLSSAFANRIKPLDRIVIAGASQAGYNTTTILPGVVLSVDTTALTLTYAVASGTVSPATPTGSAITLSAMRATPISARNDFGDIIQTVASVGAATNVATDWSSINTALTTLGLAGIGICSVQMNNTLGKKLWGIDGDSIIRVVRDGNQRNPSGSVLLGDADGALGFGARGLHADGFSFINIAVPGSSASTNVNYNDYNVRPWLIRNAAAVLTNEGHNSVGPAGNLATWKTHFKNRLSNIRAATNNAKIVACTLTPTTTAGTSTNWTTRSGQVQSANYNFSTGYVYTGINPYLRGTLNPANGDPDGIFDLGLYTGQLDGGTEDGNWPADGTNAYGFSSDGTHGGMFFHSGIAAQLTAARLTAIVGF